MPHTPSHPNLFKYATSELSQDAFLCWLAKWGNIDLEHLDKKMHLVGKHFIEHLLGDDIDHITEPCTVKVHRQYKNIDILLEINSKHLILIEDKVHSSEHSNQLARYYNLLINEPEFKNHTVVSKIFLKTGEQQDYSKEVAEGYKLVTRQDLLTILNKGVEDGVTNNILLDFTNHLNTIETEYSSWNTENFDNFPKWSHMRCFGLYSALSKHLENCKYSSVSNAQGGFACFTFGWTQLNFGPYLYAQIDQNFDVYLRIGCWDGSVSPGKISDYRSKLINYLENKPALNYEVARSRKGKSMRVFKFSKCLVPSNEGTIDIKSSLKKIQQILPLIHDLSTKLSFGE
ncbi:PD-(D/E)XK nuclease family protein [Kiloniella litopenaei]|uniref:PD-(D/E)XK nuclease family protein n=1 Tax=Kiloniella litopenaei TaxID=1549748 RepID=UPI0006977BB9|nr:PD-(D/E)XK nuclease family protein [Kiloniella litopenaei]